jgi:hypothetical protein
LDENTDISNMTHLLTFVKFENEESEKDELLFYERLLDQITSNDVFDKFLPVHEHPWYGMEKKILVCRILF